MGMRNSSIKISPVVIDGILELIDNGIKVIKFLAAFNLPSTFILNCFHFGKSCFFLQFTFFKDVFQVLGYGWNIYTEKLCHGVLTQPDGFVLEKGIYFDCAVFCFV